MQNTAYTDAELQTYILHGTFGTSEDWHQTVPLSQPRVYESWDVINFVLCPLYLYFICGCGTCREPIYWVTGCRHSVPADNGSPNQFYFFMTNLDKCKAKKYQISNILCWRLLLKPHHRLKSCRLQGALFYAKVLLWRHRVTNKRGLLFKTDW